MSLQQYIREQQRYSRRLYGDGEERIVEIINDLRRTLGHVEIAPDILEIWIDIIILALDGAWRAGYPPQEIEAALWDASRRNREQAPDEAADLLLFSPDVDWERGP